MALQYLGESGLIEVVVELLSQSKQPPSKLSKNLNLESELPQLEIIFAEITTLTGQRILFCFCYRPPSEDPSWMDVFDNFLHEVRQYGNFG